MQYCWPFISKIALTISNFLLIDTKKVNRLHDNNVNTEAKPRRYRVILLYVPLNWAIPSYGLRPGGRYCPGQSPGNSKEHPTVLPDTSSASPRYCINVKTMRKIAQIFVACSEKLNFTWTGTKNLSSSIEIFFFWWILEIHRIHSRIVNVVNVVSFLVGSYCWH